MTGFFAISSIVFGNHGASGRTRTGTPSLAVDFEFSNSFGFQKNPTDF